MNVYLDIMNNNLEAIRIYAPIEETKQKEKIMGFRNFSLEGYYRAFGKQFGSEVEEIIIN